MANIIDTAVPSYAAKIVLDLYENREDIIEGYKASAMILANRAEPVVDAAVDAFGKVKESAKELVDKSRIGIGISRLFTFVKDIPEELRTGLKDLPSATDLLAFGLFMTGSVCG